MLPPDLPENITLKLGELIGSLQALGARITQLENSDKNHFQLLVVLAAATLGLNNPLTASLMPGPRPPIKAYACPSEIGVTQDGQSNF